MLTRCNVTANLLSPLTKSNYLTTISRGIVRNGNVFPKYYSSKLIPPSRISQLRLRYYSNRRAPSLPWSGFIRRQSLIPLREYSSNQILLNTMKKKIPPEENSKFISNQSLYQRFKSNIKWILIRNKERPFSTDELGTLFSWLIISQIIWLILKTTTVLSILLLTFNTVFAKELVGETVGKLLNYFIKDIDIDFQDALVPEWKNGYIKFNNVKLKTMNNDDLISFNLRFHQVEMNLSMKKWLFGNGLINDIKILGMRGETVINYPCELSQFTNDDGRNNDNSNLLINWFSNPNYQLNNIIILDSKINVTEKFPTNKQGSTLNSITDNKIDYNIALFNLEIPKLRFNQMITDFLNATVITGSINDAMFTFHKRQHKFGYLDDIKDDFGTWKRITRLRLNSINIKDLGLYKTNAFNWIDDAYIDVIADIMLPNNKEEATEGMVTNDRSFLNNSDPNKKYLVVDLKFIFKDIKASLPSDAPKLSTGEQIISINELKPVISFINLQRALHHAKVRESHYNQDQDSYSFGDGTPNISIKRRRSYPNITIIQSKNNKNSKTNIEDHTRSIVKFHGHSSDKIASTSSSISSSSIDSLSNAELQNNELILRCRIVKDMKSLENKVLFQETGIYDQLSMELYVDLLKIVDEWEYKNKDQWMKQWGNGFASQLLLFGFASPI